MLGVAFFFSSVTAPIADEWTGNTSIISRHGGTLGDGSGDEWPYGIRTDVTNAHPDLDGSPVGFIQWQVSDTCKKIEIDYETPDASFYKRADITVGAWSTRNKDLTRENVKLPFVIGNENFSNLSQSTSGSGWNVVAVRINNVDVSSRSRIKATCTDSTASITSSSPVTGKSIMLGEHQWNGNASVIAKHFENSEGVSVGDANSADWPYGAFRDATWVRTGNKPVVFFQWYPSESCNALRLDASSLSSDEKNIKLRHKSWGASSYTEERVTLPYVLKNPGNAWTAMGLYFGSISQDSRVDAECTTESEAYDSKFDLNPADEMKGLYLSNQSASDSVKVIASQCSFADINDSQWYSKYVTALCSAGIIVGYKTGGLPVYKPGQYANWAETTKVVELSNDQSKTREECDRTASSLWYQCYLNKATGKGFNISADSKVRRGILLKYVSKVYWNKNFNTYSEAGAFMKSMGVINGLNNSGIIDSSYLSDFVSRAELAKIALNSAKLSGRSLSYGLVPVRKISNPIDPYSSNSNSTSLLSEGTVGTPVIDGELPNSTTSIPSETATNIENYGKNIVTAAKAEVGKIDTYTLNDKTLGQTFTRVVYGQEAKYDTPEEERKNYEAKGVLKSLPVAPSAPPVPVGSKVFIPETTPGVGEGGAIAIADENNTAIAVTSSDKGVEDKIDIPAGSSYVEPIKAKSEY